MYIWRQDDRFADFFRLHDRAVMLCPELELHPGDTVSESWFNRMLQVNGLTMRVKHGDELFPAVACAMQELKVASTPWPGELTGREKNIEIITLQRHNQGDDDDHDGRKDPAHGQD